MTVKGRRGLRGGSGPEKSEHILPRLTYAQIIINIPKIKIKHQFKTSHCALLNDYSNYFIRIVRDRSNFFPPSNFVAFLTRLKISSLTHLIVLITIILVFEADNLNI